MFFSRLISTAERGLCLHILYPDDFALFFFAWGAKSIFFLRYFIFGREDCFDCICSSSSLDWSEVAEMTSPFFLHVSV
jgi:hypothetical protein